LLHEVAERVDRYYDVVVLSSQRDCCHVGASG
jgi:hypothetical protein